MHHPILRAMTLTVGLAALLTVATGCSILGVAASKGTRTMIKPSYTGLPNQTVGVMVTADDGTKIDYARIQLDLAQSVQAKLQGAQTNKAEELLGTQFPVAASPNAIFAFQSNYPEYEVEPVAKVAPKLGVSRLIYIEIEAFSLNPGDVLELFRGDVSARVTVVEVTGGIGKVVFSDAVTAVFPEDVGPDGTPNLNRAVTYRGTIDALGTAVVQKFVAYESN